MELLISVGANEEVKKLRRHPFISSALSRKQTCDNGLAAVKLETRLLAMYKQDEAVQKLEALPKWYVLLSFLLPGAKPSSGAAWGVITAEACRLKSLTSGDKISRNLIRDPSNYPRVATGHEAARRLL